MSNTTQKPVLVIACCGLKDPYPCRAIDLYKSRNFKLVRAHARPRFEVLILSAEYGLVAADELLKPYDRVLDRARAAEFKRKTYEYGAKVPRLLSLDSSDVYVFGGELYRDVIRTWCDRAGRQCIELIGQNRGMGDHYNALKRLLVGGDS